MGKINYEKLAEAAYESLFPGLWEPLIPRHRGDEVAKARAVVAALREQGFVLVSEDKMDTVTAFVREG